MKQKYTPMMSVLLCLFSFLSFAQNMDSLSFKQRLQLLDQDLMELQQDSEVDMKVMVERVERTIPDINALIAKAFSSDPDAIEFITKYQEMLINTMVKQGDADLLASGKHLMSEVIKRNEMGESGFGLNLDVVPYVIGTGVALVVGSVAIRSIYQIKRMQRFSQKDQLDKAFARDIQRYSKQEKGLMKLYQKYHLEFIGADKSYNSFAEMVASAKNRKQKLKTQINTRKTLDAKYTLSQFEINKLKQELKYTLESLEHLKQQKTKARSALSSISKKIKYLDIGKWGKNLSALTILFALGSELGAQHTLHIKSEEKHTVAPWMLRWMHTPKDILSNPAYSDTEKQTFYFYLSLLHHVQKETYPDYIKDLFLGCLTPDNYPNSLALQETVIKVTSQVEHYEAFKLSQSELAQEMTELAHQLSADNSVLGKSNEACSNR